MANVVIDIATEFTGKKAFKQAETSVDKLNASTKNLGKTLTRTFGTAAILAFSRASIKAFAEDDKAATALGQTLKNLGLAYGSNANTINGFISRLEMQTGVLDDELRPAMDRLLRATGDVTQSQELLGLALDIAAGTGKSVTQVSQSLQKAYLGQTQAIGRLGVGLTKAEIESSSFEQIQERLTVLFAGQASAAAETFAGQLDKLTIAANNAKETIGKGLFDALSGISGGSSVKATENIGKLATGIADTLKNVGELIGKLGDLKPVLIAVGLVAAAAFLPMTTAIAGAIFLLGTLNKALDKQSFAKGIIPGGMGNVSMTGGTNQDTQRADNAAAIAAQKKIRDLMRQQAAAQAKIVKDKKLAAAIDKANLLLGKGGEVFDLEAIQLKAAEINQAEQLGKATSSAQELAILNDIARLNVKRSMYDLEQAILSGDQAAIEAASAKLNKDLEILAAMTGQNAKLIDIKSLLDGLQPKDLIDQANLDAALLKIKEILALLTAAATLSIPKSTDLGSGIPSGDYISPIDTRGGSIEAILEYAEAAGARADAFALLQEQQNYADYLDLIDYQKTLGDLGGYSPGMNSSPRPNGGNTIVVNTGVGDPNAIAEAVNQVLQDAIDRGTLRGGLYL
jgi:hypothetical protein